MLNEAEYNERQDRALEATALASRGASSAFGSIGVQLGITAHERQPGFAF